VAPPVNFLPLLTSAALARSGSCHRPHAAYYRVFCFASPTRSARPRLCVKSTHARPTTSSSLTSIVALPTPPHPPPPAARERQEDRKARTAVPWQGQHAARKGPTAGVLIRRLGRSSTLSSCSPRVVAMASSSHILRFPIGLLLNPVGLFQRRFTPWTGANAGLAPTPHPAGKPRLLNGDAAHGEAHLLPDLSLTMGFIPTLLHGPTITALRCCSFPPPPPAPKTNLRGLPSSFTHL
jgi:hypothetical protein